MLKNKICKCVFHDIFHGRQSFLTLVSERPKLHCFNLTYINKYVVCQNHFTTLLWGYSSPKRIEAVWCP